MSHQEGKQFSYLMDEIQFSLQLFRFLSRKIYELIIIKYMVKVIRFSHGKTYVFLHFVYIRSEA